MVAPMRFQLTFHGPFRVATGAAADGLDDTFDPDNPLPASSLKGLMRAHARTWLSLTEDLVDEVFGNPHHRSPWWWSDATIDNGAPMVRSRVRIDHTTFTAVNNFLATAGELWPATAAFDVEARDCVPTNRLVLHETVLAASATAINALGSDRRRGLGWVSIRTDPTPDQARLQLLTPYRSRHA